MRACVCVPFNAKKALAQAVTICNIWKLEKLVLYLIKFKQQLNDTKQQHKQTTKKMLQKFFDKVVD